MLKGAGSIPVGATESKRKWMMRRSQSDIVDERVEQLIAGGPPTYPGAWPDVMVAVDATRALKALRKSSLGKWVPKSGQNLAGPPERYGVEVYPFPEAPQHAWMYAKREELVRHLGISFRLPQGSRYSVGVETGGHELPYAYGRAFLVPYAEPVYRGHAPVRDGEPKAAHAKALLEIVNDLLDYTK